MSREQSLRFGHWQLTDDAIKRERARLDNYGDVPEQEDRSAMWDAPIARGKEALSSEPELQQTKEPEDQNRIARHQEVQVSCCQTSSGEAERPRTVAAAGERPTLEALRSQRDEILRVATEHGASNVHVFGSVARGEADEASDIDLLVDIITNARGLAYFGMIDDLRRALVDLLGHDVDIMDRAALSTMRRQVLRDAVPL